MARGRFTDSAGYTRHCWECAHAKEWEEMSPVIGGYRGTCEITLLPVQKYDSPNNPCSHLPSTCRYDDGEVG